MPSKSLAQHRFMEAVKHNRAFAKKAGIAQSVGRDFIAADDAAGKFSKGTTMAKREGAYGSEKGMNQHKAMAGAGGDSFGAEPFHEAQGHMGMHPDHAARTGQKGAMEDHERGAPPAVHHTKGMMPAQAAPDHGPHGHGGHGRSHDHHNREGGA
jgi:hypothetical protein